MNRKMTQEKIIIKRDFYFEYDITWTDRLKYTGYIILCNIITYFFIILVVNRMLAIWRGWAMHTIFEVLITLPTAFILPLAAMKFYVNKQVPKIYSLADDPNQSHKKLISLIFTGEAARFVCGLLPTPMTLFGTLTSPFTIMIYTLFYLNPTDRYEAVFYGGISFIDIAVFILIYILYFALHEYIVWRMFRKVHAEHIRYLEGQKAVYEKEQRIYKPIKQSDL